MDPPASPSERARSIQEQHALSRERTPVLVEARFARRRNIRAAPAGADPHRNRAIHEMLELDAPAMDSSRRTHPALLPRQTYSMEGIGDLGAPAIGVSRSGIRARSRRVSRGVRVAAWNLPSPATRSRLIAAQQSIAPQDVPIPNPLPTNGRGNQTRQNNQWRAEVQTDQAAVARAGTRSFMVMKRGSSAWPLTNLE